ncbi:hypothetical protein FIBSPDRAFT_878478 [Athelia psychrophila]|uniref:Uncharacterized protein n=1 Tax=Athelia psychrophila TaxID=1759441 RepID=A0A167UZN5_9AGAM|nr:hypothetical protein FIBSPDRAFT_878478 [Fibularhizoctonia sp. CBS 109695]
MTRYAVRPSKATISDLINSWTDIWCDSGAHRSPSHLGVMPLVTVTWLLSSKGFPHWYHSDLFLNP